MKKVMAFELTAIFLILIFSAPLYAQNAVPDTAKYLDAVITVDLKNVSLKTALQTLERKAEIHFNYNNRLLALSRLVSIKRDSAKVRDILRQLLTGTDIGYMDSGNGSIVLYKSTEPERNGSLRGRVLDIDTREPLEGVNVILLNTELGAATDKDGYYVIEHVPVGAYSVSFNYVSYTTITEADVIVRSARITFLNQEMKEKIIEGEEISITAGYYAKIDEKPSSSVSLSAEDIRRAPMFSSDITRITSNVSGISKDNEANYIMVRGGSPVENGFYIDNIPVPNINHFSLPGSVGGLVSLVNLDFVGGINIYPGGFSALYGDKMASIMDIELRQGNTRETDVQLDMNVAGINGQIEGPLKDKGSYFFGIRHSFTDIIFQLIDEKQDPLNFTDIQGKITYNLAKNTKLSFLGIYAFDTWNIPRIDAVNNNANWFGRLNIDQGIFGANLRMLHSNKGYSDISLSYVRNRNGNKFISTRDQTEDFHNFSHDNTVTLRNVNSLKLNKRDKIDFGGEIRYIHNRNNLYFSEYNDFVGNIIPDLTISGIDYEAKCALYGQITRNVTDKLKVQVGARLDYFTFNKNGHFSPRLFTEYKFSDKTSLTLSGGLFYQTIPMFFLSQNREFRRLKDPYAEHIGIGLTRLLAEDTRLTLELYSKNYRNLPMNPNEPMLSVLDRAIYASFYRNTPELTDTGNAYTRGIEFTLQKKLSGKVYGLIGATYFRSRYRGLDDVWRNRVSDVKFMCNVEGGIKPNKYWEFSVRWAYSGGIPYTPFNEELSRQRGAGVYDISRVNQQQLPEYNCLSLRVDKRYYFANSNLILFLSMWNVLDRVNMSAHVWDELRNFSYHSQNWNRVPFFGIEYEF